MSIRSLSLSKRVWSRVLLSCAARSGTVNTRSQGVRTSRQPLTAALVEELVPVRDCYLVIQYPVTQKPSAERCGLPAVSGRLPGAGLQTEEAVKVKAKGY